MSQNTNSTACPCFDDMSFASCFNHNLLRGVYAFGFEQPSLIQQRAINAFTPPPCSTSTRNEQQQEQQRENPVNDESPSSNNNNTNNNNNILLQAPPGSGRTSAAIIGALSRVQQQLVVGDSCTDSNNAGTRGDNSSSVAASPQVVLLAPDARSAHACQYFAQSFSEYIPLTVSSSSSSKKNNNLCDSCVCLNAADEDLNTSDDEGESGGSSSNIQHRSPTTSKKTQKRSDTKRKLHENTEQSIVVVSATPEKLEEMVKKGEINLERVNTVVLDDAHKIQKLSHQKSAAENIMKSIINDSSSNKKKQNRKSSPNNNSNNTLQVCAILESKISDQQPEKLQPELAKFLSSVFSSSSSSTKTKIKNDTIGIDEKQLLPIIKIFCPSFASSAASSILRQMQADDDPKRASNSFLQHFQSVQNSGNTFPGIQNAFMEFRDDDEVEDEEDEAKKTEKEDDDFFEREEKAHEQKLKLLSTLFFERIQQSSAASFCPRTIIFVNSENSIESVVDFLKKKNNSFATKRYLVVEGLYDKSNRQKFPEHRVAARMYAKSFHMNYSHFSFVAMQCPSRATQLLSPINVLVTTPTIYEQSYEKIFKKFHWTRMVINFDLAGSTNTNRNNSDDDNDDDYISSSYYEERIQRTIRSGIEACDPGSGSTLPRCFCDFNKNNNNNEKSPSPMKRLPKSMHALVVNLLASKKVTKGQDRKILKKFCDYFNLEMVDDSGSSSATPNLKMIDIS